jgi:hypothetical protein
MIMSQQKSGRSTAEGIASNRKTLSATFVKNGGRRMQRHMDLIQKILDQTEQRTERVPQPIEIDGYSELIVGQHVELLFDAGYLHGIPYELSTHDYKHVEISDLTWEGHEFLGVLRSEHGWGKIKKSFAAADLAKMPIKIIEAVAMAEFKRWAFQHMGMQI